MLIDYASELNGAQYAAVTATERQVLVVAGAGSGKTRTIVYRLAWLCEQGVTPESMLLLTFTRKAAQEMLGRAGALLGQGLRAVAGGTFHSFAYSILRRWAPYWLEGRSFTLMDSADINDAVKHCKDSLGLGKGDRSFPKAQTIAALLSKARNKELPLADLLEREAWQLLPHSQALQVIDKQYQAYRREKAILDYDDLLFELENLLATDQMALQILRQRYRHILVDEYQDTNLVQARIVRHLAGSDAGEPESGNLFVVGDDAQSIYAFRGANVHNILDLPRFFPGARVITLEENYRSTNPILAVANSLLANARESFHKNLFTRKEGGKPVRIVHPRNDTSQANIVVSRLRELLATLPANEIAVLFRAGFHSYQLEMTMRQAGIAFRKYGGLRYIEAAHVKDVLAFVRLMINPLDMPAFARIAAMHKGIGPKTMQKLHARASAGGPDVGKAFARYPDLVADMEFVDSLRLTQAKPVEQLTRIVEYYHPRLETLHPEDWPSRQQGLEEIIHISTSYDDMGQFLADFALESPEEDERNGENCITLSTVHSAKGLEWSAVLIIDLVENRFPSRHALLRPDDLDEERRLMYVACTRARQELDLYAPAAIYSRANHALEPVCPSIFVSEIPPGLAEIWQEGFDGSLKCQNRAGSMTGDADACARPGLARPGNSGSPVAAVSGKSGSCWHRIFGEGKIIERIPPNKIKAYFPGFGQKTILAEYLVLGDGESGG